MRVLIRKCPLESHDASNLYSGFTGILWGGVRLSQGSLNCLSLVLGKALLDFGWK